MSTTKLRNSQYKSLASLLTLTSALTWFSLLGQIQTISAAGATNSNPNEVTSSSQPLWSYQVKPNAYTSGVSGNPHYTPMSSIFDAFNGLSQRQGALSGSSFMTILPIILIAAGGLLLLLPFLTMMVASPFSGANVYGYNGGQFGYPQTLKKRSLFADQLASKSFNDILDHVSSTIDELSRKYSIPGLNQFSSGKRTAKASNSSPSSESTIQSQASAPPTESVSSDEPSRLGLSPAG